MSRNTPSMNDSQSSKRNQRRWTYEDDVLLVSCMVDLHNLGTHNADCGFKNNWLGELESMVARKNPAANIKARPHIESRINTLRREWGIVYDMLRNDTSGFGWDNERKTVTAEDHVWESYLISHKDAAPFRRKSFPFYDQFTQIYGKDRATGNDAQTAADILEEIAMHESLGGGINEGSEDEDAAEHGLHDMDFSSTQPQTSTVGRNGESSSAKKRKKTSEVSEPISADSIINAAMLLGDNIREVGKELSKSIGTEMLIQQRAEELDSALGEIEGLTEDERDIALSKIPDHPRQMLVFFSLVPARRLGWVRRFLATH